jgi:hypothetical protein
MATVTKGGVLADTGNSKQDVYDLVDSATVTAIVNADIDAAAAIASSKLATVAVANGGTGLTTITDGAIILGSGTGAVTPLALTTNGAIVIGDGTTDPTTLNAFSSSTGVLSKTYGGSGTTGDNIVKAWASVTYAGGVPTLQDSYNVSGITDTAEGQLTVTWDTDFATTNYAIVCNPLDASDTIFTWVKTIATGSCLLRCCSDSGATHDPDGWYCIAIGD